MQCVMRRRRGYSSRAKRQRFDNLRDHEQIKNYLIQNFYSKKREIKASNDEASEKASLIDSTSRSKLTNKDDVIAIFYNDNKSNFVKPNKKLSLNEFVDLSDEEVKKIKGCKFQATLCFDDTVTKWIEEYERKVSEMTHLQAIAIPGVLKICEFPDWLSSFDNLKMIQARISDKSQESMNLYCKHYSQLSAKERRRDYFITSITVKDHDIVKHLRSQVDDLQGFLGTRDFKHYVVWVNVKSINSFVACGYLAYFKRAKMQILSQIMVLEEFRRQQLGTALYKHFKQENKKFSLCVESPEPSFCSLIYRHERNKIDDIGCFVGGDYYIMSKWMASFYEEEYSESTGKPLGRFRYQNDNSSEAKNYRKVIHLWIACSDSIICKTSTKDERDDSFATCSTISPFLTIPILLENLHPFDIHSELAPYLPKNFKIEPICVHSMYKDDLMREFVDIYVLYVEDGKQIPVTIPEGTSVDLCIKKHQVESNV